MNSTIHNNSIKSVVIHHKPQASHRSLSHKSSCADDTCIMEMPDIQPRVIDIRSMRFMFKKSRASKITEINRNDGSKDQRSNPLALVPNAPRVFKPCRLISSLNSSMRDFGSDARQETPKSPNGEISEPCRNNQHQVIRKLSLKAVPIRQVTQWPNASRHQPDSTPEAKPSKLNIQLKRTTQILRKCSNASMHYTNESLLNEFLKYKCFQASKESCKNLN